jgi:hypothetical protein
MCRIGPGISVDVIDADLPGSVPLNLSRFDTKRGIPRAPVALVAAQEEIPSFPFVENPEVNDEMGVLRTDRV